MDAVVVLPWLPAMAIPYFSRINSANSSPREITGNLAFTRGRQLGIIARDG